MRREFRLEGFEGFDLGRELTIHPMLKNLIIC